ncbi:MAG: copper resistance protein B [Gammaproteobacteria bacterium]
MKNILPGCKMIALIVASGWCTPGYSDMMSDDPFLGRFVMDELEWRKNSGDSGMAWDGEGWLGTDLNKLWLKTQGTRIDGNTEEAELQLLYSRTISAFWDAQIGWRTDFRPNPTRDWLAIGLQGTAPYFLDLEATVFLGESGRTALRLEVDYEWRLTRQLILAPIIEIDFYGKDDPAVGVGSGLSTTEIGLRLRYEIEPRLAPYIGVDWEQSYGDTKDLADAAGEDTNELALVLGFAFWF